MSNDNLSLNDLQSNNQSPDKKFWSVRRNKIIVIAIVIIAVILALWGLYEIGTKEEKKLLPAQTQPQTTLGSGLPNTPSGAGQTLTAQQTQAPNLKTVNNDGGIATTQISTQNCTAYAPAGWANVENAAAYAFGYDAYNADQSLGASYLVTAVTVDPYGNYYQNATADEFIETTMTTLQGWSNFSWISDTMDLGDDYKIRMWQATKPSGETVKAVSQYKTWDLGDGTGSYVIVLRQGAARSDLWSQGYSSVVYDVATSVRCQAVVKQNAGASMATDSAVSEGGTSSAKDSGLSSSDKWSEAMLGYENVYDPNTGEHYEAPTSSYNNVGPYGGDPGYYKQVGNDYIKLKRGFGF